MHESACETGSQIPRLWARGIWRTVPHKPDCIGTTNPDRSVLITIIARHFQFHPVNVSNLHVKGAYVLEAIESHFTRFSHCYVTWCPLTTGIVASQYPSSRDAVLVRRCPTPLISACLKTVKASRATVPLLRYAPLTWQSGSDRPFSPWKIFVN